MKTLMLLWNTWIWGPYMRATAHWPAMRSIVPFLPLVALWWGIAGAGVFSSAFFPGPPEVIASFDQLIRQGILPAYLYDSVVRLAFGAGLAVLLGIPIGLLVGLNRLAYKAMWPILLFFQAIGDIAWLPILLIWFGFGLTTVTLVIIYTALFPIVLNTVLGVRSIRPDLRRAALSLGASRAQVIREVILPGALPNIVTGLRNGLGFGWRALIAAEIIVGTSGIGFMMFDARRAGSTVEVIVGMIVLGLLWYVVDAWILVPIERATGERWGMVQRTTPDARP